MKTIIQKCDYYLQEITDILGLDYLETKRVFKLGIREACLDCHDKAQKYLEESKEI